MRFKEDDEKPGNFSDPVKFGGASCSCCRSALTFTGDVVACCSKVDEMRARTQEGGKK